MSIDCIKEDLLFKQISYINSEMTFTELAIETPRLICVVLFTLFRIFAFCFIFLLILPYETADKSTRRLLFRLFPENRLSQLNESDRIQPADKI